MFIKLKKRRVKTKKMQTNEMNWFRFWGDNVKF